MLDYCVMSQVRYTEIRALNGIHTDLMGLVPQIQSCKLGHLLFFSFLLNWVAGNLRFFFLCHFQVSLVFNQMISFIENDPYANS